MDQNTRQILIKKLLYTSRNRGYREIEIILYNFAKMHLNNLCDEELLQFENFLEKKDLDIFLWLVRGESAPRNLHLIIKKILAHTQ